MRILNKPNKETAATSQTKPSFGIDIAPHGLASVNKSKIPSSVHGTFYDLFSPDIKLADERAKIAAELQEATEDGSTKKKQVKLRSNPKNFYTFKALFKTYFNPMLNELLQGYNLPKAIVTESALNNYFSVNGNKLAKYVTLKRVGLNFEITLPLYRFQISNLVKALEDNDSRGSIEQDEEIARFKINFWKKHLKLLPFNLSGEKLNETIEKVRVSSEVDKGYSKAAEFYKKYVKNYNLSTPKPLPVSSHTFGDTLALPAPSYESSINPSNALRILPTVQPTVDKIETTEVDDLRTGNELLKAEFILSVTVSLPYEEACFFVQSKHPKEIDVLDFIHSWYSDAMSVTRDSGDYPTYKHTLENVRVKNTDYEQFSKPKTNKDKIALTKQNKLIYLPSVDLIDSYKKSLFDSTYNSETDSYSFGNNPSTLPRNQLIYVDWVNNKVAYTTADAKLKTINLNLIFSVGPQHYLKELNTHFTKPVANILKAISAKAQSINIYSPIDAKRAFYDTVDIARSYHPKAADRAYSNVIEFTAANLFEQALYSFCRLFPEIATLPENQNDQTELYDIESPVTIKDVLRNKFFAPLAGLMYRLFTSVFHSDDTILAYINKSHRDVPNSLFELAFMLPFRQINNYDKIINLTNEVLEPYITQDTVDLKEPVKVKNLDGLEVMLSHQVKAFKKLNKKPNFAILAAAPGAGKTMICLADILFNLHAKTVTKPLILCPNGLIKDYVNESNFMSKGKLNTVPFDSTVFNNYAKTGTDKDGNVIWDYTKLKSLIEGAPINTVFVLGYDVISMATSNKSLQVYGNEVFESYSHLEFFASCGFDGVWADESQYLKGDNLRTQVNEQLIIPIPVKRLLSGTIVPNTLVDLVNQLMLFDPSILGTESQFRKKYSIDGKDSGTFSPNAEAFENINNAIRHQCTFINIQRKEWAAVLPELYEHNVMATLTPNQAKVYKILIKDAVDKMESKLTPEELEALKNNKVNDAENDAKVEKIFESSVGNLAAVEGFLSNPTSVSKDLQQAFYTTPEDLISPKGLAVTEIIREHLNNPTKYVGKILIFCNTHAGVLGIWNSLPSDIQQQTIYYSASKKADMERQFKTDENKRVLIGVSDSLDTGLNLQIADTIIRVDCVWTPGKLEQGNARINRPSLKEKDENGNAYDIRKLTGLHIYYLMVDGTIDTFKYAKLTSKAVSLAKFYVEGTVDAIHYKNIGLDADKKPIEPLSLSFDLLRTGMLWAEMTEYEKAYVELRSADNAVYREYAKINPDELKPIPVVHDGNLEDSKILRNVPYVAGAGIFNDSDLGLMPYLTYKQEFVTSNPDSIWNPEGLLIHTELGEGTVIKETGSTVHLRMERSGLRETKSPSVIFVVTKKRTSTMEIRDQLVKSTGLEGVDIQLDTYRNELNSEKKNVREAKEMLAEEKRKVRQLKREAKEKEIEERKNSKTKISPVQVVEEDESQGVSETEDDLSLLNLKFTPINEMLGLTIISDEPEVEIKMFKKYGFVLTKPFVAAEIKRVASLDELLNKMEALQQKGVINMEQDLWDMWSNIEHEFTQGRSKLLQVNQTPKSEIINFLRTNFRRVRTPSTLRALPMIMDNKLYMVIDIASHDPTTVNKVRRLSIAGITWTTKESELLGLYSNKRSLATAVKEMKADGWTIENERELKQLFSQTKIKS